jgi:uncharacterized protein YceK
MIISYQFYLSTFEKGGAKSTFEKGGAKSTFEKGGAKSTFEKGGAKYHVFLDLPFSKR